MLWGGPVRASREHGEIRLRRPRPAPQTRPPRDVRATRRAGRPSLPRRTELDDDLQELRPDYLQPLTTTRARRGATHGVQSRLSALRASSVAFFIFTSSSSPAAGL